MEKTWILTDGSNYQYGRMIREGVYEFKEFDRDDYSIPSDRKPDEFIDSVFDDATFWVQETISLIDYNEVEIENYISGYYDSLEQIKEEYGEDGDENWMWIVAECIFEMKSGL